MTDDWIVVARARRRQRLHTTSGEPIAYAEPGTYGYGGNMDEVVLCYSASEYAVGVPSLYGILWEFLGTV